ncbi:MAG TPA: hypothetical protein VF233_04045 [Nitrososphaeraceae archaeon]
MAFGIILSSSAAAYSYSQLSNIITLGVEITSPGIGQQVPVGELTISGISTDNVTADCTVYADINNTKPFQIATATGPGGVNDYSTWTFTYTPEYHLITNGTNNLTSKLSCVGDSNSANLTKYHSINLTGVATNASTAISSKNIQHRQQLASFNIHNGSSLDKKAPVEGITTSNISKSSVIWPTVAENFNLGTATSINLTGATTTSQIASEEQQPALTAVTATTPITTSTSSMVQPCCASNGYNIANAGPDQAMLEGTKITLNGSARNNNSSNFGNSANYLWRQMAGPAIILNGNNTAHPTFIAPNSPNDTKYTFALEVFDENQFNNKNQTGAAIDTVDIMVKDVNTKSKKDGSIQEQVLASNYKSQSETESFMVAPTNGENDKEEEEGEEKNADRSDTSSSAAANQYDQVEEIEKVKEKEKPDTDSVIKDKVKKGSESEEDEQEKQKTEESELIEKLKEKEKRQEDYDDDGSGSNSGSNFIDNHITSFSNNYDDKEDDVFIFNYDIKLKKFKEKMNQNIENLKDRLENSFNER